VAQDKKAGESRQPTGIILLDKNDPSRRVFSSDSYLEKSLEIRPEIRKRPYILAITESNQMNGLKPCRNSGLNSGPYAC
jgi:hypothetical protein